MKTSSTFLVTVIVSACLLTACWAARTEKESNCRSINPFLVKLVKESSANWVFNGKPQKLDTITCAGIWAERGTCCDKKGLLRHVESESYRVKKASDDLKETIQYIANHENVDQYHTMITNSDFLDFIKKFINPTQRKNFIESLDQCADFSVKVRSNAFCSICSGNSYKYFSGEKAIISMDTCKSMLNHCKSLIEETVDILESIKRLHNFIVHAAHSTMSQKKKGKTTTLKEKLRNEQDKLDKQPMLLLLKQYNQDMKTPEAEELKSKLCSSFYHLIQPTWIEQVGSVLKSTQNVVTRYLDDVRVVLESPWYKSLSKKHKKGFQVKNQARGSSRSLIADQIDDFDDSFTIFTDSDVVIMKKSDNMFDSYDGVKGSTLNNDFSDAKPMDLDTPFP